ncbi:MAG: GNAT family N-acetyltransferase [Candidatus Omnitrophota bacterium]
MNHSSRKIQIQCFDNFEAIHPADWDALAAKSPTRTIFQTYAWQRAWWRAHGKSVSPLQSECELCLVAGYDGDVLVMILSLVRRGDTYFFVGDGSADRLDALYDAENPSDLQDALTDFRAREDWRSIELNGIVDVSPTWRYLKVLARQEGFFPLFICKLPIWGLVIQGREERVRRHLHTGTLAKHAAIFASKGMVRLEHQEAPDPAAVPWQEFFVQHIHRWSLRSIPSIFVARATRDLCRYFVNDPQLRAYTILTTLYLNDRVAAYHLGFIYDQVFYWHMPSFDLRVKRFCPDDVLWREVVAYAYKCGCREVSFTSSDEPAVRRFGERVGVARSVRIYRRHRDELRARVKRWMDRVPLALGCYRLVQSLYSTLGLMVFRKRIVKQAHLAMQGIDSFEDLYVQGQTPGRFDFNLARPEVEIIRRLKPELKDMSMLDIGIGHGRTSVYFSPVVKRYDAFDHVPSLVALARADLDDLKDCRNITQADAVRMKDVPDGFYDFILFSADGLDESCAQDRLKILQEVRRVGREGAWFFFSSRNLQSLTITTGRGVLDFFSRLRRRVLMSVANENWPRSRGLESVFLLDEKSGYRLPVYFGTPKEQVRVLKDLGFHDLRVFSTRTGLEVRDWRRWDKLADESLYYLCRV